MPHITLKAAGMRAPIHRAILFRVLTRKTLRYFNRAKFPVWVETGRDSTAFFSLFVIVMIFCAYGLQYHSYDVSPVGEGLVILTNSEHTGELRVHEFFVDLARLCLYASPVMLVFMFIYFLSRTVTDDRIHAPRDHNRPHRASRRIYAGCASLAAIFVYMIGHAARVYLPYIIL